jgi:hypothetical protein
MKYSQCSSLVLLMIKILKEICYRGLLWPPPLTPAQLHGTCFHSSFKFSLKCRAVKTSISRITYSEGFVLSKTTIPLVLCCLKQRKTQLAKKKQIHSCQPSSQGAAPHTFPSVQSHECEHRQTVTWVEVRMQGLSCGSIFTSFPLT